MFKKYFYYLSRKYLSIYILDTNSVIEIDPTTNLLVAALPNGQVSFRNHKYHKNYLEPYSGFKKISYHKIVEKKPDFIVLSNHLHYERDVQSLLQSIYTLCNAETRLILNYYNSIWRPLSELASFMGLRNKLPDQNWLSDDDVKNLLHLENFELIKLDKKVLIPIYIPLISNFVNRFIAPLPYINQFALLNIVIARPQSKVTADDGIKSASVSIIIPARNEAGNIQEIVKRIPKMGPRDEYIFIEGNSSDDTWKNIQELIASNKTYNILAAKQDGVGKGDAVRKGFSMASNEILMILDADMTVPPEDLPKFYNALIGDKGEFVNGSRLIYPMEKKAMRFFNLIGNKFFAAAFSYVLGQRFKDTLCGTKVISRANYLQLARSRGFFGEFDPFGDFDLIFGAARMGLKIVEIPVTYRDRVYGSTNISRWRHGLILLVMLLFSSRKIKFI